MVSVSKCNLPPRQPRTLCPRCTRSNTTSSSGHTGVGRVSVTWCSSPLGRRPYGLWPTSQGAILKGVNCCDRLVRSKTRPFFRNSVLPLPTASRWVLNIVVVFTVLIIWEFMIYLNNSYSLIQATFLYVSKTPMICDHCYLIGIRYYRNECILHWELRY